MDNREFKKTMSELFKKLRYKKIGTLYYKDYGEIVVKFDLQKSNYSDGWYVNYSITIKEIHNEDELVKKLEYDISERIIPTNNPTKDLIEIEQLSECQSLLKELENKISCVNSFFEENNLEDFYREDVNRLKYTCKEAKEYLLVKYNIK